MREYLKKHGHEILEHNAKSKYYEIDIVSTKDGSLYFTEVKYRKNAEHGAPLEMITSKKQKQMKFAAECYQKAHPGLKNLQPILASAAVSSENPKVVDFVVID